MHDVAAAAGVALKTVSRVVNDEPGVNPVTAERVREAIRRLGYRRNESARFLREGRTASIGLVIEDVSDPFYSGVSRAVETVARRHGHLLFTGSSEEDPDLEREIVMAFCARRVDGLIIVPAGTNHEYLRPELTAGVAIAFVDRPPEPGLEADTVLTDNHGGAAQGVAHLIRHGHRRIAFLGDDPAIYTARERLRGYRTALAEAGLPYDEYFADVERVFRQYGGRPHWGKKHSLTARELRPLYPAWDTFAEIRRRLDPDGVFLTPDLARLLEQP